MYGNLLYRLAVLAVRIYARVLLKLDVRWLASLPAGPKLFVANHPSATDPFVISQLLYSRNHSRHLSVLISGNAFAMPIFGGFLRRIEQISAAPGQARSAFEQAQARLRAGHSVAIFPEGLVSPRQGGCHPPRSGAARLALSTGVPVIPVGIYLPRERSYYIASKLTGKPTAAYWYLYGPYGMTVGRPLQFRGQFEDAEAVRSVTASIMENIALLAEESERRVRGFFPAPAGLSAI
jgi:1-acyl-sn-glycerol-3-phosphate acyltransferase